MCNNSPIHSIELEPQWTGAYVLHIVCTNQVSITIGRFNQSRPVTIELGEYVYTGSAMGSTNGLQLPKRLMRHASRTDGKSNHTIRNVLLEHLANHGVDCVELSTPSPKKLRWNIDYVLDHEYMELRSVLYIRSNRSLERSIAEALESNSYTSAPYSGFGAHDHPGHTHFLSLCTRRNGWAACIAEVRALLEGFEQ